LRHGNARVQGLASLPVDGTNDRLLSAWAGAAFRAAAKANAAVMAMVVTGDRSHRHLCRMPRRHGFWKNLKYTTLDPANTLVKMRTFRIDIESERLTKVDWKKPRRNS
jgi:hypothetical protein